MTKSAEPSTPSGFRRNSTTKATDHELPKYDIFTRYGQGGVEMWVLVVVFLASSSGFSISGYSSDDTCEAASNELWSKVNIQATKLRADPPKIFAYCTQVK
jgi:hypothetical protein